MIVYKVSSFHKNFKKVEILLLHSIRLKLVSCSKKTNIEQFFYYITCFHSKQVPIQVILHLLYRIFVEKVNGIVVTNRLNLQMIFISGFEQPKFEPLFLGHRPKEKEKASPE